MDCSQETPLFGRKSSSNQPISGIWGSLNPNFAFFGNQSPNHFKLVSPNISAIQSMGDFEVIIVGGTPLDVQHAQKHGLQVVAVAIGLHSVDDLHFSRLDLLITD
jgi:hypothetical protein